MQVAHCLHITAGAALVGAGVIAVTPPSAPSPDVQLRDIQLTADDEPDIDLFIVRHALRGAPNSGPLPGGGDGHVTTSPPHPGVPLAPEGHQEALADADHFCSLLGCPDGVAAIATGQGLRAIQTGAPFADAEHMTPQILPGLNEVDPGVYGSLPDDTVGSILYQLTVALWGLGFSLVPIPESGEDYNGVVFDKKFTDAVDTMYQAATDNPVHSADGDVTAVGFNSEAAVAAWMAMNVKNPDLSFFVPRLIEQLENRVEHPFLPNAGIVEFAGNPTDGWTVVSWNGTPVPQQPGLPTELFVDYRDLVLPIQKAMWDMYEAFLNAATHSEAPTAAIASTLQTGIQNIGVAMVQFPESVINDIVGAVSNLGADAGGQAAGETGAPAGDAFASLF